MNPTDPIDSLRVIARRAARRSCTPYSGIPTGGALLLSDGTWVPGVRVESVSFGLVIPALTSAIVAAVSSGRRDAVAVALSRDATLYERAFMHDTPFGAFRPAGTDAFVVTDALPLPSDELDPGLDPAVPGICLARTVAQRAWTPASDFPVGCVLKTTVGRLLPGVNVEHSDWIRTLCAERSALAVAAAFGAAEITDVYLTCPKDRTGSPCGACRQLLWEFAPAARVWIDRGDTEPDQTTPSLLLPGAFRGSGLSPTPTDA